jgi:hypothetical protein
VKGKAKEMILDCRFFGVAQSLPLSMSKGQILDFGLLHSKMGDGSNERNNAMVFVFVFAPRRQCAGHL